MTKTIINEMNIVEEPKRYTVENRDSLQQAIAMFIKLHREDSQKAKEYLKTLDFKYGLKNAFEDLVTYGIKNGINAADINRAYYAYYTPEKKEEIEVKKPVKHSNVMDSNLQKGREVRLGVPKTAETEKIMNLKRAIHNTVSPEERKRAQSQIDTDQSIDFGNSTAAQRMDLYKQLRAKGYGESIEVTFKDGKKAIVESKNKDKIKNYITENYDKIKSYKKF